MRQTEININGQYAIKWDLSQRGKLPMGVFRGMVLDRKPVEVSRYNRYSGNYTETVEAYVVEVMEVLRDSRWAGSEGKPRFRRGISDAQDLIVGETVTIENGQPFVAPWLEYIAERTAIEQAEAEQEAADWESEERSALVAERLAALGFSVRQHGLPHRPDYVPRADYTVEDTRLTLDALERLVTLAERNGN